MNTRHFIIILVFIAFSTTEAHAYIDPGSGSAIMSVIIGFFVAAGIIIKTFWYKIAGFLGLSKTSKDKSKKPKGKTKSSDTNGK